MKLDEQFLDDLPLQEEVKSIFDTFLEKRTAFLNAKSEFDDVKKSKEYEDLQKKMDALVKDSKDKKDRASNNLKIATEKLDEAWRWQSSVVVHDQQKITRKIGGRVSFTQQNIRPHVSAYVMSILLDACRDDSATFTVSKIRKRSNNLGRVDDVEEDADADE